MKRQHEEEAGQSSTKRVKEAPEVIRGGRPIYRFFLVWKDNQGTTREVPARCLLDWGSTSFAISKRFVSALEVPTIKRAQAFPSYNASGQCFSDDGKLRTALLRFAFGNHCWDEVFEVMLLGEGIDVIVPFWWMQKHGALGIYDGTLRSNDCPSACFHSLSPGWSITYDCDLINLPPDQVFNVGAITSTEITINQGSGPSIRISAVKVTTAGSNEAAHCPKPNDASPPNVNLCSLLPEHYHKYLLLFEPEQSEKLPEHRSYDHAINLMPGTEPR
jgi:hypothetical protein